MLYALNLVTKTNNYAYKHPASCYALSQRTEGHAETFNGQKVSEARSLPKPGPFEFVKIAIDDYTTGILCWVFGATVVCPMLHTLSTSQGRTRFPSLTCGCLLDARVRVSSRLTPPV
jgi:hypothetical protein